MNVHTREAAALAALALLTATAAPAVPPQPPPHGPHPAAPSSEGAEEGAEEGAAAAQQPSPAWKQERFVISMCLDPIVEPDQLEYRYQEMADANFTLVPSTAWMSPGWTAKWSAATLMRHAETSLAAAEKAGLAMLGGVMTPGYDNATDHLDANASLLRSDSPALWGYALADEPSKREKFIELTRERAAIERHRPGKLSFVNRAPPKSPAVPAAGS